MEGDIIAQALEDMARYWNEFKAAVQKLYEQVKRVFEKLCSSFYTATAKSKMDSCSVKFAKYRQQMMINHYDYMPVVRKNMPYMRRRF